MKKGILLAVVTLSLSIMLFGCGAKSTNKAEETTEFVTEEPTTEEVTEHVTEEPTTEEVTEPVTEEPTTEEAITEANNVFTYYFEGIYWVQYGDYETGYYFDGVNATIAYGDTISVAKYSVDGDIIKITYEDDSYDLLRYGMFEGAFSLEMDGQGRLFGPVSKEEFESKFMN